MSFKKKIILNIGVSLGIVLLLGAALFFLNSEIQNKVKQITEAKKGLNFRSQLSESITLLRNESEQVEPYLNDLENILITKDKLVNFSQDIKTIGQQNQINLNFSFGAETPKTKDEPGKIGLIITADGNLNNLISFLRGLENSKYFVKLNKLDLTKQGDKFKGILNGEIFYF
ncbi:MAG: type 4a pilus biogenesis protein PilO [Patescibacteria group bacterium]